MFAYCGNNPITRSDPTGELFGFLCAALVGAVVNVATTYIAAKVTGQEYTLKDAAVAALSGAACAIPTVGPVIGGLISGVYTGYSAYQNGASLEGAFVCGIASGLATTFSIGNLSSCYSTMDLAAAAFTDFVFGTGYNSMSAAIYKGVTDNSQKESNSLPIDSNNPQVGSNYPTNKTSSCFGAGHMGNIGGGVSRRINIAWMAS